MNELKWSRITPEAPERHQTVLLYRRGTLYPIVGSRWGRDPNGEDPGRDLFLLEPGGPEDGEHRTGDFMARVAEPTHWAIIPELPLGMIATEPCTGVSASWCPNCGDCTCPGVGEADPPRDRSDPRCPLHAPGSEHGVSR